MTSNREKKRIVQRGLRVLKGKPGWDPTTPRERSPQDALRELETADRLRVMDETTEGCENCHQVRRDSKDETALCESHLAKALGF